MPRAWAVRNCFQAGPAAGRGAGPGVVQDLPDRAGSDPMAEPEVFAWHAPVSPCRVLGGDADHELADRGCRRRSPGTPPAGVVPSACDPSPAPGKQRRRVRANTSPTAAAGSPEIVPPATAGRLVADLADLAAQHRVLVPEHQQSGVPGRFMPGCECRKPHPCHATRRYSLIVPPARACFRTRYCSRSAGSGSGAAPSSDRWGRC
jgi:hypothetical protein